MRPVIPTRRSSRNLFDPAPSLHGGDVVHKGCIRQRKGVYEHAATVGRPGTKGSFHTHFGAAARVALPNRSPMAGSGLPVRGSDMLVKGIDHVTIRVHPAQVGAMRAFYADLLGLEVGPRAAHLSRGVAVCWRARRRAHRGQCCRGCDRAVPNATLAGFDHVAFQSQDLAARQGPAGCGGDRVARGLAPAPRHPATGHARPGRDEGRAHLRSGGASGPPAVRRVTRPCRPAAGRRRHPARRRTRRCHAPRRRRRTAATA